MPLNLSPDKTAFNARGDGVFMLPFEEQIAFFRQKLNLPTEHYDDILAAAHDRAFMVAGAAKADLLTDLRGAVDKAIADGKSIQWFRKQFDSIVQTQGWDYRGGRDWRTRIIYTTNLSASYAAGRYRQLTDSDLLQTRPYWKYLHNDSVMHPRPLHVAWSGTVLRYNDPWWQTHFPPNGWGCRCRVVPVRENEFTGETAPDDGTYEKIDRWGDVHEMPKGVDYGWDYQPGRSNAELLRQVIAKQDGADWRLARANTHALVASEVFTRWHNKIVEAARTAADKMPGAGKAELVRQVRAAVASGEQFPIAVLDAEEMRLVGAATQTVSLSDYDLAKQAISREGQGFTAADYIFAQDTIERAQRILRDKDEYTLFIHRGNAVYVAVLQRTKTGKGVFLKSFRRGSEKDAETQLRKVKREGGEVLKDEW
jgi:uncharacterized protein with gpF-like domain